MEEFEVVNIVEDTPEAAEVEIEYITLYLSRYGASDGIPSITEDVYVELYGKTFMSAAIVNRVIAHLYRNEAVEYALKSDVSYLELIKTGIVVICIDGAIPSFTVMIDGTIYGADGIDELAYYLVENGVIAEDDLTPE